MKKQKKIKTIRNYSILAIAVVFLITFSIINSPDDGELNDYEIYTPEVVVNESNQTSDINQASAESITGLLGFLVIIGIIIGTSWAFSFINSFILGGGTEY